jgi:hypothetical protein
MTDKEALDMAIRVISFYALVGVTDEPHRADEARVCLDAARTLQRLKEKISADAGPVSQTPAAKPRTNETKP